MSDRGHRRTYGQPDDPGYENPRVQTRLPHENRRTSDKSKCAKAAESYTLTALSRISAVIGTLVILPILGFMIVRSVDAYDAQMKENTKAILLVSENLAKQSTILQYIVSRVDGLEERERQR